MSKRSNVRQLDKDIQREIGRLIGEGVTLDSILEQLRSMGVESVSRSGLGRHAQVLKKAAERQAQAEAIAEQFVRNVQGAASSNIVRGAVESLGSLLNLALENMDGESISPKDFQALGRTLESLGKAKQLDITAALKVEEQAAKETDAADGESGGAGGRLEVVFVAPERATSDHPLRDKESEASA